MTIISSGRQQPAFNMPSIRAEAILPNPRNPKVMCEREVIRLPAGCKGGEWANGRMGVSACRRVGVVLVLVLPTSLATELPAAKSKSYVGQAMLVGRLSVSRSPTRGG